MKIRIENLSAGRALHVEPFDQAGDPPEPVSAGVIAVLPGQASTFNVHDLRSLQVYEGEIVKPGAPDDAGDTPAPAAGDDGQPAQAPGEAA